MTKANYQACLKSVLKWEGGYADHPKDSGGATNTRSAICKAMHSGLERSVIGECLELAGPGREFDTLVLAAVSARDCFVYQNPIEAQHKRI